MYNIMLSKGAEVRIGGARGGIRAPEGKDQVADGTYKPAVGYHAIQESDQRVREWHEHWYAA